MKHPHKRTSKRPDESAPKRLRVDADGVYEPGLSTRAALSLEQFKKNIQEGPSGTPVLKQFFDSGNSTASWVKRFFPLVELEVHQLSSFVEVARDARSDFDIAELRKRHDFLGAIAADAELQKIIENPGQKAKDLTAEIFARFLRRGVNSVKKWSQHKK